jgi:hypothetical protein
MLFIVQRGHCCCDHLTLETSKAPRFSSQLNDPLYRDFDAFFLSWVGEVLDRVYDLFNNRTGGGVNPLLRTTASERSKECLLAPDCFFPSAFVSDVVAHRQEQGIGLIVATAQAKQERAKDTVCDKLGHRMCYVCSTDLSAHLC